MPAPPKLSLTTKLFYGFGTVAFGVKDHGFSYLLLIFYNQVVGLPAATVGLAIMVALMVDSLMDPVIGQVSDNWRSRWGRRHPFMYAAAVPVALSYIVLWNPPAWGPAGLFAYLVVVAIVIRTFISLYEIPSAALAAELTVDYDERTKVLSYRHLFGWLGGPIMAVLALQVFLKPDAAHPVGQLNPAGYVTYSFVAAGVMLAAILISALGTHGQIRNLRTPPARKVGLSQAVREMASTLTHRTFLPLMGAGLFNAMALGLTSSLTLYLGTYFWEFSAGELAAVALSSLVSAGLAFALAAPISRPLGKKNAAQFAKGLALVFAVGPILLRVAGLFPANGDPLLLPLVLVASILNTAFAITSNILISSMTADVVEDAELRTGRRSEGLFFAGTAFIAKAVSGVGIFASSMILWLVSFPQSAQPGQVTVEVIDNLGLTYVGALTALYAAAIGCIALYRISRQGHEEALRQLAAKAQA